jgi:hypothetical protein
MKSGKEGFKHRQESAHQNLTCMNCKHSGVGRKAPLQVANSVHYMLQCCGNTLPSQDLDTSAESSPDTSEIHNPPHTAEMNRRCLVLFDMNNRIFGPYLAATHRILISAMTPNRACESTRIANHVQSLTSSSQANKWSHKQRPDLSRHWQNGL